MTGKPTTSGDCTYFLLPPCPNNFNTLLFPLATTVSAGVRFPPSHPTGSGQGPLSSIRFCTSLRPGARSMLCPRLSLTSHARVSLNCFWSGPLASRPCRVVIWDRLRRVLRSLLHQRVSIVPLLSLHVLPNLVILFREPKKIKVHLHDSHGLLFRLHGP